MVRTRVSITIARPPQQVFPYFIDPAKMLLWQSSLVDLQAEPGLPVGSTGMAVTQILGQRMLSRFEVLENDGRGFYAAKSAQGPLQYRTTQTVEAIAGGSRVTNVTDIDAGTIFKLAEGALESIARARFESDLKTLKALLESQDQLH
jgi:hypothetical protein